MRISGWKRVASAACLTLAAACAYGASASAPSRAETMREAAGHRPVLRGTRVLTLAGYELNVAFTTGGKVICFDISAS